MSSAAFFCRAVLARGKTSKMDSIKSKMKNLAEATQEATTRANVYEEEIKRVNDIAEKFEEQVGLVNFFWESVPLFKFQLCPGPHHPEEDAVPRGSV